MFIANLLVIGWLVVIGRGYSYFGYWKKCSAIRLVKKFLRVGQRVDLKSFFVNSNRDDRFMRSLPVLKFGWYPCTFLPPRFILPLNFVNECGNKTKNLKKIRVFTLHWNFKCYNKKRIRINLIITIKIIRL